MEILLNIISAWVATIAIFVLSIIYNSTKAQLQNKDGLLFKWNKKLRKYHKPMGILAIIFALIHGFYSSFQVVSLNKGTLTWLVMIFLGIGYMVRKKLKGRWAKSHRIMAFIVWVLLVLHIFEVGGFIGIEAIVNSIQREERIQQNVMQEDGNMLVQEEEALIEAYSEDTTQEKSNNIIEQETKEIKWDGLVLRDGTYTGIADGYGPDLMTRVMIDQGILISVEVTSHNELKEQYWGRPIEMMPKWIVEEQSIEVDTIAGATFTSYGIMMSVQNALEEATISGNSEPIIMPEMRRGKGGR